MKKIIFIFLSIVLLISSCIKEYATDTEFNIINETNYNIKIIVPDFKIMYTIVDTIFFLLPKEKFSFYYSYKGTNNEFPYPFGQTADSVYFIFNDTVSVTHIRNDTSLTNILDLDNYTGGKVNDSFYEYFYSITDDVYNEGLQNE